MAINGNREHVTVGIVGGGIGGLALAKMLEMSGISYRLFEAHDLVPDTGASIGLMPNGLRILDQLDVVDTIEKWSVQHDHWEHRDGQTGDLYAENRFMRAYPETFGYGAYFMDRQRILRTLFESIEDKTKLQGSKKVVQVHSLEDSAIVEAADGSSFSCQVVVGADGVHSVVRKLIRQKMPRDVAPDYLTADSYCVFGISTPIAHIGEGRHFSIYQPGSSVLVFSGLGGKLYWFIFKQFSSPVIYGERRKFTDEDVQVAYSPVAQSLITEGVRFSDIYKQANYMITLPVEQGICETWYADRMVLVGDAAHKMAPHAAMGANVAMESAAGLVNELRKLGSDSGRLTTVETAQCLEAYANKRKVRVTKATEMAAATQKVLLKVEPQATGFLARIPKMRDDDWLRPGLFSLCQAEKLEDWKHNSDRVELYSKRAREVNLAASEGKENKYMSALMDELTCFQ